MRYISSHFSEIRLRFSYITLAFLFSLFCSYINRNEFLYLTCKPFLKFYTKFLFFELTEAFYTTITLSIIISVLSIVPYSFYQLWSFSIPGRYKFERRKFSNLLKIFILVFVIEFVLIYNFIFPLICEFFISFEIKSLNSPLLSIEFTPRIQSYIGLLLKLFSTFLFLFQLPFVFFYLFTTKFINCYTLCEHRKVLLFLVLVFSSLISPPDFVSQLLVSGVFYLMYEFIVFLGFFFDSF